MKTTKLMFTAPLILAALVLFIGSLAYADCGRNPVTGDCVGNCPTLFTGGNFPKPVRPWVDPLNPQPPCHAIGTDCKCEYRTSSLYGNTCQPDPQGQQCIGECPALYPTVRDAKARTNPVQFAHHECHGDTVVTLNCFCIYY